MANSAFGIRYTPSEMSLQEAHKQLAASIRERGHDPANFTFRAFSAYDVAEARVIASVDAHEKEQTSGKTDRSQP